MSEFMLHIQFMLLTIFAINRLKKKSVNYKNLQKFNFFDFLDVFATRKKF
jgi:hypothetical protein